MECKIVFNCTDETKAEGWSKERVNKALLKIQSRVRFGYTSGTITDDEGNVIGTWEIK